MSAGWNPDETLGNEERSSLLHIFVDADAGESALAVGILAYLRSRAAPVTCNVTPPDATPLSVSAVVTIGPAGVLVLDSAPPVVTVTAENPQQRAANVDAHVQMMSRQLASPLSRSLPMASQRWSSPVQISLQPREKRTFTLPITVALAEGTTGWFTLRAGKKAITAAPFSVPGKLSRIAPLAHVKSVTR